MPLFVCLRFVDFLIVEMLYWSCLRISFVYKGAILAIVYNDDTI